MASDLGATPVYVEFVRYKGDLFVCLAFYSSLFEAHQLMFPMIRL